MARIGIFDSGAGGLSVFREIYRLLPDAGYVYFSDNAFCPYGDKPREFIITRARQITDFLLSRGADIIVVACNTATAAAISSLREACPHVPFIGMEPAVKPAASLTRTGVIGVLATAGTLSGQKYRKTRDDYAGGVEVVEHIGEGFVELVESGCTSGPEAERVVRASLQPLLDAGADVIVLGCTHYPFLIDVIRKIAGPAVSVIDPAPAVARHLIDVLKSGITDIRPEASAQKGSGDMAYESISPLPGVCLYASGSLSSVKRLFPLAVPSR